MSHETIIENIKAELEHVEASALHSIWQSLDKSKRQSVPPPDFTGGSALAEPIKWRHKINP
jgi:hypothetical protein